MRQRRIFKQTLSAFVLATSAMPYTAQAQDTRENALDDSGLAGEILQKFVNYRLKVAIVGDYSRYTSKPLHDFIRESNRGRDVFFVSTIEDAVELLTKA